MKLSCGLLALVLSVRISLAQEARLVIETLPEEVQSFVVSADPSLQFRTTTVDRGRRDADTGVLRAQYRIGRRVPLEATVERTARAYFNVEADEFGWPSADDFVLVRAIEEQYSHHLTFQQVYQSVPVLNRFIQVNTDAAGNPTMVLSGYAPELSTPGLVSVQPSIGASEAEARARQAVSTESAQNDSAELFVYPGSPPRLVWRVTAWPDNIPAEWEVLIDAHSGEVVFLLNRVMHGRRSLSIEPLTAEQGTWEDHATTRRTTTEGTGLVFDPDPLTSAGVSYGGEYTDQDDADVAALNNERVEVPLTVTQGSDGLYRLESRYVRISGSPSLGGVSSEVPAEADPHAFKYTRANQLFEAVMAYYHIDKSQRYLVSLGFGFRQDLPAIRVNPHGLGTADNSKFLSSLYALAFGDGGIDDAEDAEVILHEYAHAILDMYAPGLLFSGEGRALHEGWSDYWAVSYTRGLIESGKVPQQDWRKVFSWDGNETWDGRRLNHQGIYPGDVKCAIGPCREVDWYTDGVFWATSIMEVYDILGKTVTDHLHVYAQRYLIPSVTFMDAAEALVQANVDLYGGADGRRLLDALAARGLVDLSRYGPTIVHQPETGRRNPGATVTFTATVQGTNSAISTVTHHHRVNGGAFRALAMEPAPDRDYSLSLTLPSEEADIDYYIEATALDGLTSSLPADAPEQTYSFSVTLDRTPPAISHHPETGQYNSGATIIFAATVRGTSSAISTVTHHHRVNGGAFRALAMELAPDGDYNLSLTLPSEDADIDYYIEATALDGLTSSLPADAPEQTYSFTVVLDRAPPVIAHDPLQVVAQRHWPVGIAAVVTDDTLVDSVWVDFNVHDPHGGRLSGGAFPLHVSQDQFTGAFPNHAVPDGGMIRYRLYARDAANPPNEVTLPTEDAPPYVFSVSTDGVVVRYDWELPVPIVVSDIWQRGAPTYGTAVAHSGQHVIGTLVGGPYGAQSRRAILDLPPIRLPQANQAFLEFWHWHDFEFSNSDQSGVNPTLALWDGGNIKASLDDQHWFLLEPVGGYTGSIQVGRNNPLAGEEAFGGYSYGWQRALVRLPCCGKLNLRFDVGMDDGNDNTSQYFAGWMIDDVRIIIAEPLDTEPPEILHSPMQVMEATAGSPAPPFVIDVQDNVGVASVVASYSVDLNQSRLHSGEVRLDMARDALTRFEGRLETPAHLSAGQNLSYRFLIRDFNGNVVHVPDQEAASLLFEVHLREEHPAFTGVRISGHWQPRGTGYTIRGAAETPVSSLVLKPVDLPEGADLVTLKLTQSFRFGPGSAGNVKYSLDDGVTWTNLLPAQGYNAVFEPTGAHPMRGQPTFAGSSAQAEETTFTLAAHGGEQVRLRLDYGVENQADDQASWEVMKAVYAFSTTGTGFEFPRELTLHANFPDPFWDTTTITYTLPATMPVTMEVYNILGQRVRVLVDAEQEAGTYSVTLDGGDLGAGVYILRMMTDAVQMVEQMVLAR